MSLISKTQGNFVAGKTYIVNDVSIVMTPGKLNIYDDTHDFKIRWAVPSFIEQITSNGQWVGHHWRGKSLFFFLAMLDRFLPTDYTEVFKEWPRRALVRWAFPGTYEIIPLRGSQCGNFSRQNCDEYVNQNVKFKWNEDFDLYVLGVHSRISQGVVGLYDTADALSKSWSVKWVPPCDRKVTEIAVPLSPKTRAQIAADEKASKIAERIMQELEKSEDFSITVKVDPKAFPKIQPVLTLNGFAVSYDAEKEIATISCV